MSPVLDYQIKMMGAFRGELEDEAHATPHFLVPAQRYLKSVPCFHIIINS
jgi:hypothetical protein